MSTATKVSALDHATQSAHIWIRDVAREFDTEDLPRYQRLFGRRPEVISLGRLGHARHVWTPEPTPTCWSVHSVNAMWRLVV